MEMLRRVPVGRLITPTDMTTGRTQGHWERRPEFPPNARSPLPWPALMSLYCVVADLKSVLPGTSRVAMKTRRFLFRSR